MTEHTHIDDRKLQDSAMMTTTVVSAFASRNPLHDDELQNLLRNTLRTFQEHLSGGTAPVVIEAAAVDVKPIPAVPIKKSVTEDAIVCLEDGKRFKSLKRHLRSAFGMTPKEYRVKWGLPPDYPMTAPSYAARRSTLARSLGLGRKPAITAPVAKATRGKAKNGGIAAVAAVAKRRRGRPAHVSG